MSAGLDSDEYVLCVKYKQDGKEYLDKNAVAFLLRENSTQIVHMEAHTGTTWCQDMVAGLQLDSTILKAFSNLCDSMKQD